MTGMVRNLKGTGRSGIKKTVKQGSTSGHHVVDDSLTNSPSPRLGDWHKPAINNRQALKSKLEYLLV